MENMENKIKVAEPFQYSDFGMWEMECEKFEKNRLGIGFYANVTVLSFEEKELQVSLSAFPPEYVRYQGKLMGILSFIAKYAFWFVENFSSDCSFPSRDIEEYELINFSIKRKYMEMFLNLLVQEGKEIFLSVLMEIDAVHSEKYELQTGFRASGREWIRSDGLIWDAGSFSFVEPSGTRRFLKELYRYVIIPFGEEPDLGKDAEVMALTQYKRIYYDSLLSRMSYDIGHYVWKLTDGSIWNGKNWVKENEIMKYGNPCFWQLLPGKVEEGESFSSPFEKMKHECQCSQTLTSSKN